MRLCPTHGLCCQRSELWTAIMCCMLYYFYIQNEYFGRVSQHSHVFCMFLFYLCKCVNVLVLVSKLALCCQARTLVNWVESWLCRWSICVVILHIPVLKHDWLSRFKITRVATSKLMFRKQTNGKQDLIIILTVSFIQLCNERLDVTNYIIHLPVSEHGIYQYNIWKH
jgi:hypothetical protein